MEPRHVKTIKEIFDEECENGEEITYRPFKDSLNLRSVKTRTATMAKDGIGHTRPDSPLSWNIPARFGRRDDEQGKKVTRMTQQRSPPAKMSLMALLADEDDERNDGGENDHQDAAAMSCGHNNICGHHYPRELWASHENCPDCSSFIMEILDVL